MQNSSSPIRLVVRADDAGSCLSANQAIQASIDAGLTRNVSIMVPGPAFADAVQRFARRGDICVGLHITLNAEWKSVKWGPVSAPESVASLLDGSGHFTWSPQVLAQRGFVVEEVLQEIAAQLAAAREAGFKISYVDEHMGVSRIGIRRNVADLCRREGLIDAHGLPSLALDTSLESARTKLSATAPGDYIWVIHPGKKAPDMLNLHLDGQPNDGSVAHQRDAERALVIDPALASLFRSCGVKSCRYDELFGAQF